MEALRIWIEHGPGRTLVGPAGSAAFAAVALRGDYAAGYRAARRIVTLSEPRDYEPGASQARFIFSVLCCWFEPVENGVREGQRALEGLIAGGDLLYAGHACKSIAAGLTDCAPSLDVYLAEMEAGLAFLRRTGNEEASQSLDSYRWLAGVLRGESPASAGEAVSTDRYAETRRRLPWRISPARSRPPSSATWPACAAHRGGDAAATDRPGQQPGGHSPAAARAGPGRAGPRRRWRRARRPASRTSRADPVAGRTRPGRARQLPAHAAAGRGRAGLDRRGFPRGRPGLRRRPARGRFAAAAVAPGPDRRARGPLLPRPWPGTGGHELLAQARQEYIAWGATAKAGQLDWAYPALRPPADPTGGHDAGQPADIPHRRSAVTTGTVDLLGIVSASQALSSETSVLRLHARVVQVLSAMTGATGVRLLLWSEDRQGWLLAAPEGVGGIAPASGAGQEPRRCRCRCCATLSGRESR